MLVAWVLSGACSLDARKLEVVEVGMQPSGGGSRSGAGSPMDGGFAGTYAPPVGADDHLDGSTEAAPSPAGDADAEPEPPAMADSDSGTAGSDPAEREPNCDRLVVEDGWIDGATNCLDIQGEVLITGWENVYRVQLGSDPVCIALLSADSDTTLRFYLNQPRPGGPAFPYNAALNGVVGFRVTTRIHPFGVGAAPLPFAGVEGQDAIYCLPVSGFDTFELRFDELRARCWETSDGPTPDVQSIEALVFHVPRGWQGEEYPDMCVGNITALFAGD